MLIDAHRRFKLPKGCASGGFSCILIFPPIAQRLLNETDFIATVAPVCCILEHHAELNIVWNDTRRVCLSV
jgi:hypothetical protein